MSIKYWLVLIYKSSNVNLIEFDSLDSLNDELQNLVPQEEVTGYKVISGLLLRDAGSNKWV